MHNTIQNFHSEEYPLLKQAMMEIGQKLSKPDFQITIYALTKAEETNFGSDYAFRIKVVTPDDVSEEETTRQVNEKNWQETIIQGLLEYYPDGRKEKNGLYLPRLKAIIEVPDTIFSKYSEPENG